MSLLYLENDVYMSSLILFCYSSQPGKMKENKIANGKYETKTKKNRLLDRFRERQKKNGKASPKKTDNYCKIYLAAKEEKRTIDR